MSPGEWKDFLGWLYVRAPDLATVIAAGLLIWGCWRSLVRWNRLSSIAIDLRKVVFVWASCVVTIAAGFGRHDFESWFLTPTQLFLLEGPERYVFDVDDARRNPILLGDCPTGRPERGHYCMSIRLLSADRETALFHAFGYVPSAGHRGINVQGGIGEFNELGEPLVRMNVPLDVGCGAIVRAGAFALTLRVLESTRAKTSIGAEMIEDAPMEDLAIGLSVNCPITKFPPTPAPPS
jgi:hypothetical protein